MVGRRRGRKTTFPTLVGRSKSRRLQTSQLLLDRHGEQAFASPLKVLVPPRI